MKNAVTLAQRLTGRRLQAASALVATFIVVAPQAVLAESKVSPYPAAPRVQYVAYVEDAPVIIATAPNQFKDIAFGPGELVIKASIVDGSRWASNEEVRDEIDPHTQRIARFDHIFVRPDYLGLTTELDVRTDRRHYRVILQSVNLSLSSQAVRFIVPATIIDRTVGAVVPDVAATASAMLASATLKGLGGLPIAEPRAAASAPEVVVSAPAPTSSGEQPPAALAAPPLPYTGRAAMLFDKSFVQQPPPASTCPRNATEGLKVTQSLTVGVQAANALIVGNAVKHGFFQHVVFGTHGWPFYLGVSLLQDVVVHQLTRRACPSVEAGLDSTLAGAAGINAVRTLVGH